MINNVTKRPAAIRDIEQCFVYIAEDDIDIGIKFLVAVEDSIDRIAEFPQIGKVRSFRNNELPVIRMWPVKTFESFLIFYAEAQNEIEIVRVLHGSRDIESLFG